MANSVLVSVGARLALARTEAGYSQLNFSKEAQVSLRSYQKYEAGERNIPIDALVLLHEKFGVDMNWLLLGEKAFRQGHDLNTLESITIELRKYIRENNILIKDEKFGSILSKWYQSIVNGGNIQLVEVINWIELLKEE